MPNKNSFIPTEGHAEFGDIKKELYENPELKKPTMSGFEAYAKDGFSKIGEPTTSKKRPSRRLGIRGAEKEYSPINPNAKILSKSKRPVTSLYTSGKNKGKTKAEVLQDARKFYNSQPKSYRDAWEAKGMAQGKDINTNKNPY